MPRTIANIGIGNPATYTLTGAEAFTILAVTCVLHAKGHNKPYGHPTMEYRDQLDGLIYRQTLNTILNDEIGVAASSGAEPWYLSNNGQFGFPQDTDQQTNAAMTIRLPAISLTPGCSFGVYVAKSVRTGNEKPAGFFLSPDYEVIDLHLWVQDAAGRKVLPPNPPPLLTHQAA